jgi:hypothetical protein
MRGGGEGALVTLTARWGAVRIAGGKGVGVPLGGVARRGMPLCTPHCRLKQVFFKRV